MYHRNFFFNGGSGDSTLPNPTTKNKLLFYVCLPLSVFFVSLLFKTDPRLLIIKKQHFSIDIYFISSTTRFLAITRQSYNQNTYITFKGTIWTMNCRQHSPPPKYIIYPFKNKTNSLSFGQGSWPPSPLRTFPQLYSFFPQFKWFLKGWVFPKGL